MSFLGIKTNQPIFKITSSFKADLCAVCGRGGRQQAAPCQAAVGARTKPAPTGRERRAELHLLGSLGADSAQHCCAQTPGTKL